MNPLYRVSRINAKDEFYGNTHYADTDKSTLCGLRIDSKWYILTNDHSNKSISCRKCLSINKRTQK